MKILLSNYENLTLESPLDKEESEDNSEIISSTLNSLLSFQDLTSYLDAYTWPEVVRQVSTDFFFLFFFLFLILANMTNFG